MRKRVSPLPEAVDGSHWIVKEGAGSCDTIHRILRVPTDDSPSSRFVRNHEVGHAKITPRVSASKQCQKFAVSMEAMQICEDLRVHRYLGDCGISLCGNLTDDEAEDVGLPIRQLSQSSTHDFPSQSMHPPRAGHGSFP